MRVRAAGVGVFLEVEKARGQASGLQVCVFPGGTTIQTTTLTTPPHPSP